MTEGVGGHRSSVIGLRWSAALVARALAHTAFVCTAVSLGAQASRRVDSSAAEHSIAVGRPDDAESALYAASARAPREPSARAALGAFLASRGHLKVGAVLLEEARQFGGDAKAISARLKHVYAWTGEWQLIPAPQGAAALPEPDAARVRWLAAHAATRAGPDSSAVSLEPNEVFGLGRIALVLGGTTVTADIDPNVEGILLPATMENMAALERFGSTGDTTLAVALRVGIGVQVLSNVPARLEPDTRVRVGLDVLAAMKPTFDLATHRLTLRPAAKEQDPGEAIPFLLGFPGVRIVPRRGSAPVAIESSAGRAALRGGPWTFDLRHGVITRG